MKLLARLVLVSVCASIGFGCGDDTGSGASVSGGGGSDSGGGGAGAGGVGGAGAASTTGGGGSVADGGAGGAAEGGSTGEGGGTCAEKCAGGLDCCGDQCVGKYNDIFNCGACGNECQGENPYCNHGVCAAAPPCDQGKDPPAGMFCCGLTACNDGELCCAVPGPGPTGGPACYAVEPNDPATQTCAPGCPLCD